MKATTVLWTKQTVRLQPQMILSKSWCPGQNRLEINAEPRTEAEELNAKEEKRLPSTKLFPAIIFGRSRFKSQLYQLYICTSTKVDNLQKFRGKSLLSLYYFRKHVCFHHIGFKLWNIARNNLRGATSSPSSAGAQLETILAITKW